jgi:hypothetical protein
VKEAEDSAKAKKAAAAIESVIRKHQTQESYNRIRQVTRPNSGGGLQRVDVPKRNDDGNVLRSVDGEEIREVLLEVDDIHKALLERNRKYFHQADETPFAGGAENSVLYDLLGYTGMSKAAREVVDGSFLDKYGDNWDISCQKLNK